MARAATSSTAGVGCTNLPSAIIRCRRGSRTSPTGRTGISRTTSHWLLAVPRATSRASRWTAGAACIPSETPARPPGAVAADPYNTSAQQTLINQDRSANGGLAPLAWNDCLAGIAKQNADRIAAQGYLSHTNGPTLDLSCLPGATYAGENIAYTSA